MNINDIVQMRLAAQQITTQRFTKAKDLAGWMGAMQAQDFAMAVSAAGLRLTGAVERTVTESFDNGEMLRTHVLRPTWHLVSPENIAWMRELSAPHIRSSLASRHRDLGLTGKVLDKSVVIIRDILSPGRHLTGKELEDALIKGKIKAGDRQAYYHILLHAELEGIVCSGRSRGKEPTYALTAERAPEAVRLTRDRATAKLAELYFTSHGPATVHDFSWWSGLSLTDARSAARLAGPVIASETIGPQEYFYSREPSSAAVAADRVHLLPAYDEFIISYRDRSLLFSADDTRRAVSSNGIFRPVLIVDGRVAGIWRRIIKKHMTIEITLFTTLKRTLKAAAEEKASAHGIFLNRKAEVLWK